METKIYRYPMTILESHLDSFGHVHHSAYLQIFEQARWEIVTSHGYGLERVHETGLGPVILELKLKFRKELRLRQKIIIETKMDRPQSKLSTTYQWIQNESGQTCCTAEFLFGLFDLKNRKLVPPTSEWIQALGF